MKKTLLTTIATLALCISASAQISPEKYIALTIPDSLRKGANAVVREDLMKFRVKDIDDAVLEVHTIITVLNEEGDDNLDFEEYSDKFWHLEDAEIKVYNAYGKKLNTYSKKEMQSFAYGDGLVEDGKITRFRVSAAEYPITIEQIHTTRYSGLLSYPTDYIQNPEMAVEHVNFSVEVPTELGLRYKAFNINIQPVKEIAGNKTTYTWDVKNLKAKLQEYHSGPADRNFPHIALAPNNFKIGGYEGNMSSWKDFGMWSYQLIGSTNQLSDKTKMTVIGLTKNASSDKEKARIIYNYLQQNMRYVSIQLGIGGWKPFAADFVQEKKYGDCKALSNYMQAALNAVGIKSYYALINAGSNATPALEEFPSNRFNHVILCIPQPKDSIWLECTSNTTDFGELGDFTENRKALLITEKGGVLVSTPTSHASQNTFHCKSSVVLNEDGSGTVKSVMSGTGEFKQEEVAYLNQKSTDEQERYFVKGLEWKHPEKFTISNGNRFETPYITSASMDYPQLYAFKTGSKMFLQPRFYSLFDERINDNTKRSQDYMFPYPYIKQDTTIFTLPAGFSAENLPDDKSITTAFGKYNRMYSWDEANRKLTIAASISIIQNVIKVEDYSKLMLFKKQVDADMNERLVVKKD